jgi:opacity protein-like surface antigen
MNRRLMATTLAVTTGLFGCLPNVWSSQIIYGASQATHLASATTKRVYYLQLGTFSSKSNAEKFQRSVKQTTQYPVSVIHTSSLFSVRVGPLNADEVRQAGSAFSHPTPKLSQRNAKKAPHPMKDEPLQQHSGSWYLTGLIGGDKATVNDQLTINNGANFTNPNNIDIYTTNAGSSFVLGLEGGYQFTSLMLPALSIGVRYTHYFNPTIDGQVIQYSIPAFTNYNYQFDLESDVLLATAKMNFFTAKTLNPFIRGGVGMSWNNASRYSEVALPNVTPRISPSFVNHTQSAFAYQLGAGLDWKVKPQWLVSLAYEYSHLGNFSLGNGTLNWSNESLSAGSLSNNAAVLGLTYVFQG